MRLINNYPITQLSTIDLSPQQFGLARSFLAHGERLKSFEQRLNFLKRCKSSQIFPAFIQNNLHVSSALLFPSGTPHFVTRMVDAIKLQALRIAIANHFNLISQEKRQIIESRQRMSSYCSSSVYYFVQSVFEENNERTKCEIKRKLKAKFELQRARQRPAPPKLPTTTPPHLASPPPMKPESVPEERVTTLLTDLTPQEKAVLELGPNFALAPTV